MSFILINFGENSTIYESKTISIKRYNSITKIFQDKRKKSHIASISWRNENTTLSIHDPYTDEILIETLIKRSLYKEKADKFSRRTIETD